MFIALLTLVLLYAFGMTFVAVGITGLLHMGGPGWANFLYPLLFAVASYIAAWFARNRIYAACGAAINLVIALALRPFDANWFLCVLYSALWFGAAWDVARTRR